MESARRAHAAAPLNQPAQRIASVVVHPARLLARPDADGVGVSNNHRLVNL